MNILMYHLVADLKHPMAVPPSSFRDQMQMLADGAHTVVGESELHAMIERGIAPPSNAVLITFDDGYANTITTALPILQRAGLPAVMAVCGGYLTADLPRRVPHPVQDMADIAQMHRWVESGRDIAAHSYTHRHLTEATDTALRWQITGEFEVLTDLLGHPPRTFAYPYGAHDARVRSAVAEHYRLALSTDEHHRPDPAHPYALTRIQVDPSWSLDGFATALAAGTDPATAERSARDITARSHNTRRADS